MSPQCYINTILLWEEISGCLHNTDLTLMENSLPHTVTLLIHNLITQLHVHMILCLCTGGQTRPTRGQQSTSSRVVEWAVSSEYVEGQVVLVK